MVKKREYNRQDRLYKQAKEDGFSSRAAYKLIELNKRFNLIKRSQKVLDLGAWPGGWIQVAAPIVGPNGLVIGIDLKEIDTQDVPAKIETIVGDVSDESILEQALSFADGPFDVILSDMSPKITGIRLVDEAALSNIYDSVLSAAYKCLKQNGSMVLKAFKGNEAQTFFLKLRPLFNIVKRCELDSTRKSSNEFYIVCLNFKDGTPCRSSTLSHTLEEE